MRWALEQDPAGVERHIRRALTELPNSAGVRGVVEPCLRALVTGRGGGADDHPSCSLEGV